MNNFEQSVEQIEEGVDMLAEARKLYQSANESESLSEILKLTLKAINKDLEAYSLIWEATIRQKEEIERLCSYWDSELNELEMEALALKSQTTAH